MRFTALVPPQRSPGLKSMIEQRKRWRSLTGDGASPRLTGNRNPGEFITGSYSSAKESKQ